MPVTARERLAVGNSWGVMGEVSTWSKGVRATIRGDC
jgi:hypothetical protein